MEDLLEQANEIQESLSRSYAVPDELDEGDLEAGKPAVNSAVQSIDLVCFRARRPCPRTGGRRTFVPGGSK